MKKVQSFDADLVRSGRALAEVSLLSTAGSGVVADTRKQTGKTETLLDAGVPLSDENLPVVWLTCSSQVRLLHADRRGRIQKRASLTHFSMLPWRSAALENVAESALRQDRAI